MSDFKNQVISRVHEIPVGMVVSYGQVASACGKPRASRGVGMILNKLELEQQVPWWRVINAAGRITIKGSVYSPIDQKRQLELEGVEVSDDFTLDIDKYRYDFEAHSK